MMLLLLLFVCLFVCMFVCLYVFLTGNSATILQGFLLSTVELILVNLCESLTDAPDQNSWADECK